MSKKTLGIIIILICLLFLIPTVSANDLTDSNLLTADSDAIDAQVIASESPVSQINDDNLKLADASISNEVSQSVDDTIYDDGPNYFGASPSDEIGSNNLGYANDNVSVTLECLQEGDIYVGDPVDFRVNITNVGTQEWQNVTAYLDFDYFDLVSVDGSGWQAENDYWVAYDGTFGVGKTLSFVVTLKAIYSDWDRNYVEVYSGYPWKGGDYTYLGFDDLGAYIMVPDLDIDKTASQEEVNLGDSVSFNVTVSKYAYEEFRDSSAPVYHDIVVTDHIPNGLEFETVTAVDPEGNAVDFTFKLNGSDLILTVPVFDKEYVTFTIDFKTIETGYQENVASIEFEDAYAKNSRDGVLVTAPLTVYKELYAVNDMLPFIVVGEAEILRASPWSIFSIYSGDNVTFGIAVNNTDASEKTNVIVEEIIPEGLTYLDFKGENWTYLGDGKFKLNHALAPGSLDYFFITFKVSKDFTGNLTNKVHASADNDNGSNTSSTIEVFTPNVGVDKQVIGEDGELYYYPYVPLGDSVVFNITVYSRGDSHNLPFEKAISKNRPFFDIDVIDYVPDGLEFLEFISACDEDGNSVDVTYELNGSNIVFHIPEVYNYVTISVKFNTTETGWLENVVTAGDDIDGAEVFVYSNLTVDKSCMNWGPEVVKSSPSLSLVYPTFIAGDNVTFIIEVINTNEEEFNFTDVTIVENIPEGLTLIDFESYDGVWIQESDNKFVFNHTLTAGQHAYIYLTFRIDGDASGIITNKVTASSKETDPVNSSDKINVVQPNIGLNKTALNKTVFIGDEVVFNITVTNEGIPMEEYHPIDILEASGDENVYYRPFFNVEVVDTVPEGLEFVNASAVDFYGDEVNITFKIDGSKVIFTIPELLYESVVIQAVFKATQVGEQTNVVTGGKDASANDTVDVKSRDVMVTITVDEPEVKVGDIVEFLITVTNIGDGDVSGLVVKIDLDKDLEYLSDNVSDGDYESTKANLKASESGQTYDPTTGEWTVGDLAQGESVSMTILARATAVGEKKADVEVSVNEDESNYTNNVDSTSLNVTDDEDEEEDEPSDPVDDNKEEESQDTSGDVSESSEGASAPVIEKSGNPIFVLLLVLSILACTPLRRFKK